MYLKETVQTQIQENWQENFLKRGKMLMNINILFSNSEGIQGKLRPWGRPLNNLEASMVDLYDSWKYDPKCCLILLWLNVTWKDVVLT